MTTASIRMQLMMPEHDDHGVLRRSSMPEFGSKKPAARRTGLRRSSLSVRQEPTRVNATWDIEIGTSRRRSAQIRALLESHCPMSQSSPTNMMGSSRRSILMDETELESLTAKLWSNQFAGTIDPRFHSQYLQGTV